MNGKPQSRSRSKSKSKSVKLNRQSKSRTRSKSAQKPSTSTGVTGLRYRSPTPVPTSRRSWYPNAFLNFMTDFRKQMKYRCYTGAELVQMGAVRWRRLSAKARRPYMTRAENARAPKGNKTMALKKNQPIKKETSVPPKVLNKRKCSKCGFLRNKDSATSNMSINSNDSISSKSGSSNASSVESD